MKKVLCAASVLFVMAACGQGRVNLSETQADESAATGFHSRGDISGISVIQPALGEVKTVMPNCPPNAMCEPVSEISFIFTLNGCVDRLGPVAYTYDFNSNGKLVYQISGIDLQTYASKTTRCVVAETKTITVRQMGIVSREMVEIAPLSSTVRDHIEIPEFTKGVDTQEVRLASAEVLYPHCLPNERCRPVTKVTAFVSLGGCVDQLGPVFYSVQTDDSNEVRIEAIATVLRNKESETVRCYAAPVATTIFEIPGAWTRENIVLGSLGVANSSR